jgi:uncharacterized protein YoxC
LLHYLTTLDPLTILGLSLIFVAISLTALVVAAIPALWQLVHTSRSAEKLLDTLNRELPPTLEAMRMTGLDVGDLSEELTQGLQGVSKTIERVERASAEVKQQALAARTNTHSFVVGIKVAWQTWQEKSSKLDR